MNIERSAGRGELSSAYLIARLNRLEGKQGMLRDIWSGVKVDVQRRDKRESSCNQGNNEGNRALKCCRGCCQLVWERDRAVKEDDREKPPCNCENEEVGNDDGDEPGPRGGLSTWNDVVGPCIVL